MSMTKRNTIFQLEMLENIDFYTWLGGYYGGNSISENSISYQTQEEPTKPHSNDEPSCQQDLLARSSGQHDSPDGEEEAG